jgi:hypothetical protein
MLVACVMLAQPLVGWILHLRGSVMCLLLIASGHNISLALVRYRRSGVLSLVIVVFDFFCHVVLDS